MRELRPGDCHSTIYEGRGWNHQCSKKPIVERDGKLYCKIHDPKYVTEKRRKWQEEYDKEWIKKQARWHRAEVIASIFEDISTATIERSISSIKDILNREVMGRL